MTVLFHISDLHFGREDRQALRWFAAVVEAERPAGIVVTGDVTQAARRSEFAAATAWLRALPAPVSIEIGNHDIPVYNPVKRAFFPYRRYERLRRQIARPLELEGISIVPLRTATRGQWRSNWSLGVVRRRSLETALATLGRVPAGQLAVVACHHPLVDEPALASSGRTRGGVRALEALAAAGAHAVISGHVHDPFDVAWPTASGDIRLIGAGTLSERTRDTPPSFNEIAVQDGALVVRVRTA
ncbi:MAG: metallophosphoesterase [Alphaproteobacteria bacterium]|nr:metallophosphoesterase [Alphaproteobacteria bacterium]